MRQKVRKRAAKKVAKKTIPKKKSTRKVPLDTKERTIFVGQKRDAMYRGELIVNSAEYLHDYTIRVQFSDGKDKEVDFSPFFEGNKIQYYDKYKDLKKFKKFKIEEGNIVWGKEWDMIFPVMHLYSGKVTA